jgi:glycosyltransferase involved in cell wall biosynthesis
VTPRHGVAFVVQRYGADITGGSEALARELAERWVRREPVTVFTTCARDYVTWRNEYPAGTESVAGVEVRRFPAEAERDLAAFNRFSETLYGRPHGREDELQWLRLQGPVVPSLVEALRADKERFRAIVFFTYLYYPTYHGLQAAPEHSVLVPTTHDEPPLRFDLYREVFALPRAFAFLAGPEEALVRSRFDIGDRTALVAGMGVEAPGPVDPGAFRERQGLSTPYALYAGRIDAGKGCAEMLGFYGQYRRQGGQAELVLIGTLAMELPPLPGLRYLGFLAEDEKRAALAGARVVVCPSAYESFSIVLLEGFALGTPGLVNARSAVLKDHCLQSGAGLYYEDGDEFAEALELLLRDEGLRAALGAGGRAYVQERYAWDAVLARYATLIDAAAR